MGKVSPQVLRSWQALPGIIWTSHSWLGDLCPWNGNSEVSFGSQRNPSPRESTRSLLEEEPGPALVRAWLLGSRMNLSPLAGFCTFNLMISGPYSFFNLRDSSFDSPDPRILPRISSTVPAQPLWWAKQEEIMSCYRSRLAMPFGTHPIPTKCVICNRDNLNEPGGNRSPKPRPSF